MLSRAKMRGASESFKLVWLRTLQMLTTLPPKIQSAMLAVMKVPEPDFTALYRWFESMPIMRQWIGDRKIKQLRAQGFQVNHEPFESTLGVLRDDIMFDKLGGYRPAIQKMAQEMRLLPYRRMLVLMRDAFTGSSYTCFDGYPLFSASHTSGANASANNFSASNLDAAKDAMRAFVNPDGTGDPLLIEPTHLWYHNDLTAEVEDVIDIQLTTAGMTNKHYKSLEKVPLYLGSGYEKYWGLWALDPTDPLKPIIWQYVPGGDDFVSLDNPDSEQNFMRRQLLYGTEAWGAITPGFPWYAWGSTGT